MTSQNAARQRARTAQKGQARPRIGYLSDVSPLDRGAYSGGNARIFQALSDHVGDVTILPQHWGAAAPVWRLVEAMPDPITHRARWRLHLALARIASAPVNRALRQGRFDILFGAYSFHALAGVRPPANVLTLYTSDATPAVYKHSEIGENFGSFFAPSRLIDPLIERVERRVFRSTDLLLWPSDWLRDAAQDRYGLDPGQSVTLPWGANIEPPAKAPPPPAPTRDTQVRLLLVGRDWTAKGGPIALRTLEHLRAGGVNVSLTVVGCDPDEARGVPGVTVHPYLDKSDPQDRAQFENLFRASHFMLMPSYESYGFAFCEASAYGLPSICLAVGGVPVRDGINGHALPADSDPQAFADVIAGYLDRPEAYVALRNSTRKEYEDHLNWDAWGRGVAALVARLRPQKAVGPGAA